MFFVAAIPQGVYAYEDGDKMDFTSRWAHHAVQFTAEDGFKGCCAQAGIERDPEGVGTINAVYGRNSNMAKVAYYVYSNGLMASGESAGHGLPSAYLAAHLGMNLIQICNQGKNTWAASDQSLGATNNQKLFDLYDEIIAGDRAPLRFQVLRLKPNSNSQTFVVWRMSPIGRAGLQKSPAGGVPNPKEGATLKGAKYYVYSDQACTKRVTVINDDELVLTTKEDGSSNLFWALPGTYYAKEITPSPGYDLDPTVRKITVTEANTEDNPAMFKSTEPYEAVTTGMLKLIKASALPEITD